MGEHFVSTAYFDDCYDGLGQKSGILGTLGTLGRVNFALLGRLACFHVYSFLFRYFHVSLLSYIGVVIFNCTLFYRVFVSPGLSDH